MIFLSLYGAETLFGLVSIDIHFLSRYYSHEDGVCKDFLYKGERGNRNRFLTRQTCESSCFEAQDVCELPKARFIFLKTFDIFLSLLVRWSVHATETWSNSGTTKRKTTASPSTTADVKGMGTSLTLSPSVRTGYNRFGDI